MEPSGIWSFVSRADALRFATLRVKATAGNAGAQLELGCMFLQGRVAGMGADAGAPDYVEACVWFRRAAEQGNAEAQNALGVRFNRGEGVEPLAGPQSMAIAIK